MRRPVNQKQYEVLRRGDSPQAIEVSGDDLYIWELLDVDTTSEPALLEFVRRWGPGASWSLPRSASDAYYARVERPAITKTDALLFHSFADYHEARLADLGDEYPGDRASGIADEEARVLQEGGEPMAVSVGQVRFGIHRMRNAVRVLIAQLSNGRALSEEEALSHFKTPPETWDEALEWATGLMKDLLSPFSPRVALSTLGKANELFEPVEYERLCALQLFNDLVSATAFRACRKCGRPFARQHGRASIGSQRRDANVVFCSDKCARAAASKAYRDRRKADAR